MNNKGIYVLSDRDSKDIGFYDLSSFGAPPVIQSQPVTGSAGSCGFIDENTALCATQYPDGDIYKYDVTNNYEQLKIADNNPSFLGFYNLLVTKDKKHILATCFGCMYIYTSSGDYLGYSNNSQEVFSVYQMKEIRGNIIVSVEDYSVYSRNINNPVDPTIHKLLDYVDTHTWYQTIEGLEWNTGDMAIGGYDNSSGTEYGYVQLFHLNEDNATLYPIPNKRWVGIHASCHIQIIREIQIGVIIFGGDTNCPDICTWQYAICPYKDSICFSIGSHDIQDIISIP